MPMQLKEYQLSAKTKGEVFGWYEADRALYPKLYLECSPKTFNKVWKRFFDHLKVRKWLRFSKCAECILLRSVRDAKRGTKTQKQSAEARSNLNDHYQRVKAERHYFMRKQYAAEMSPEECIYISLDGTDQLGYGFPHFLETGKEEKERIKAKIMVGCVPGFGVFCFDHGEYSRGPIW
jgi:hypothetical protein